MTDLLLIGAGGFARETAEAVRAINAAGGTWNLLGFLDDRPELTGTVVTGVPVIGPIERAREHPDARLVICTGRPDDYASRPAIAQRLRFEDARYATLIHPTATVGASCAVGAGSVLLAHADLTADVVVGRHVAVMPQAVLTHDTRIGDWATIASGVRLGGGCRIGEGAYIGAGACLREDLSVGEWAIVGMGSVVTRAIPAKRLWYGAPARDAAPAPASVLSL